MVALAFHRVVLLPVVEEQVVQESRPRRRARVKMELPAEQEVVVGYVQAVLQAGRPLVVGEFPELLHRTGVQQVVHAVVVFRELVDGLTRE